MECNRSQLLQKLPRDDSYHNVAICLLNTITIPMQIEKNVCLCCVAVFKPSSRDLDYPMGCSVP